MNITLKYGIEVSLYVFPKNSTPKVSKEKENTSNVLYVEQYEFLTIN